MVLTKEEFLKYSKLSYNKNYIQNFGFFVRLLRRSRIPYFKKNKMFMSAMQMNMVRQLSDFQEKVREAKKEVKEKILEEDVKFSEKKLFILKEWIRTFQTITDGIAWRNLKFNRPLIRLMSENDSVGHISRDEVNIYTSYLKKLPHFIIINDLTRCLRISDLTQILPNGKIVLYELKESGKLLKDVIYTLTKMYKNKRQFFTRQELKQWVVQSAIIEGKINVPTFKDGKITNNFKADIVKCDINIKNHFQKIKKLFRQAKKGGFSQEEVEEGYFIEVRAWDKVFKKDEREAISYLENKERLPAWVKNKGDKIINISNYDCFKQEEGQYARNFIPFSVLPFSSKDCVRLMMGQIYTETFINLDALKSKFEQAGWDVKEPEIFTNKEYEAIKGIKNFEDIEKYEKKESFYFLSKNVGEDKYFLTLSFTLIIIMMTSFYKFDFLIDWADYMFNHTEKEKHNSFTINFFKEQKILK